MPRVFVCYRRDDSAASAGRVFDRLVARFGQGNVFMDVDTIRPGQDFAARIEGFVADCDSLVAIVGREWLRPDGAGTRRIDDPSDYVRLEIHAALTRDTQVIPVLVTGASMPTAEELPPQITAFSGRQAIEVSESRFGYDCGRLIEAIEEGDTEAPRGLILRLVGWFRAHPKPGIALGTAVAAGAVLAVLAATGVFSTGRAPSSSEPASGVVDFAYFYSGNPRLGAPAVTALPYRPKTLFVRFHFRVRPNDSEPVVVAWVDPARKVVTRIGKPNTEYVDSSLSSPRPFEAGKWAAVLFVGKVKKTDAHILLGDQPKGRTVPMGDPRAPGRPRYFGFSPEILHRGGPRRGPRRRPASSYSTRVRPARSRPRLRQASACGGARCGGPAPA